MAKCELRIEIDGGPRAFRAGEAVTGRVLAQVDGELTPKEIVIEQIWKTHGRGNTDLERIEQSSEPGRPWMPGQTYSHSFRFEVPARPASYHGHLVNVDHYITARADVAWKIDPRGEADYLVEPGPASRDAYLEAKRKADDPAQGETPGCLKVVGWILGPILILMLVALLLMLLPILLAIALGTYVRRSAAERKLGNVKLEVKAEPLEDDSEKKKHRGPAVGMWDGIKRRFRSMSSSTYVVSPGQAVPVSLTFTPRDTIEVESIRVELSCVERATAGSGTNSHTYTHTVLEETLELSGARMLSGGSQTRLDGILTLPDTAPFSFKASDNEVLWSITTRIDIPRWPDWVHKDDLLVVPAP